MFNGRRASAWPVGAVHLVGIVNVTPDSFSDGGRFTTVRAAIRHALMLIAEGADVIDIGGESTRPGAQPVPLAEELRRVVPVIQALRKKTRVPISIDTYKPLVTATALAAGATWVNDSTGLRDPAMRAIVARAGCSVILMHMQGMPGTMQRRPRYHDVINDINDFFRIQIAAATKAGIHRSHIILDPGIGFGKTVHHNLEILHRLGEFKKWRLPILIGASRKSFIGILTNSAVDERLPGTLAAHLIAVQHGATLLRVHDVAAHKQALAIADQLETT